MNNIGLYVAIRSAHKAFNGVACDELCAVARKRIKHMERIGDARSRRDIDALRRAVASTGAAL